MCQCVCVSMQVHQSQRHNAVGIRNTCSSRSSSTICSHNRQPPTFPTTDAFSLLMNLPSKSRSYWLVAASRHRVPVRFSHPGYYSISPYCCVFPFSGFYQLYCPSDWSPTNASEWDSALVSSCSPHSASPLQSGTVRFREPLQPPWTLAHPAFPVGALKSTKLDTALVHPSSPSTICLHPTSPDSLPFNFKTYYPPTVCSQNT